EPGGAFGLPYGHQRLIELFLSDEVGGNEQLAQFISNRRHRFAPSGGKSCPPIKPRETLGKECSALWESYQRTSSPTRCNHMKCLTRVGRLTPTPDERQESPVTLLGTPT